jgi:inner membrane protein
MASAFAHAAAGAALWPLFRTRRAPRFTWALGAVLATLPDLDVIGFRLGVAYDAPLGHRGLTHSLIVALVFGSAIAWAIARRWDARGDRLLLAGYLVAALASHGLLDAMTTGGLGVALFAPIDNGRYFLPWRPIAVSPIGIRPFLTQRGIAVLSNEAIWVGIPSLCIALLGVWMSAARLRNSHPPLTKP